MSQIIGQLFLLKMVLGLQTAEVLFFPKVFGIIIMFSYRPCRAEPGKVRYQIPSRFLSSAGRKGINQMQSFCRWAVVPEWCRCLFFYDAAVFLYSGIERNDTRNFREKKILRVALSGTLEVKRVNHILYIICLYIIYSHIIYIYIILYFVPVLFP